MTNPAGISKESLPKNFIFSSPRLGQAGPSVVNQAKAEPNGAKQGQTGSKEADFLHIFMRGNIKIDDLQPSHLDNNMPS